MAQAVSEAGPDRYLRFADGRRITYRQFGSAGGRPVLAPAAAARNLVRAIPNAAPTDLAGQGALLDCARDFELVLGWLAGIGQSGELKP